jgi:hypothetical protein
VIAVGAAIAAAIVAVLADRTWSAPFRPRRQPEPLTQLKAVAIAAGKRLGNGIAPSALLAMTFAAALCPLLEC